METGGEVALSRGASKRPADDAQQSHRALRDLFELLRDRPEREATNILRRIRSGESVDHLLTSYKNGDRPRSLISPESRGAIKTLLTNLLRSGASLEQIASAVVYEVVTLKAQPSDNDGRRPKIPHSVFDGSGLVGGRQSPSIPLQIGSNAARKRAATVQLSNQAPYGDDKLDVPPFILPAKPWTDITDNSIFVSCLVRDFLNYHNPYWRFLEADLFLQGMRTGKVGSDFCSPLLVNAVCALACLHVDYQDAFVQPGDLPTRGEHFHDEALHLWLLEEGRASVTNLQALAVLAIEYVLFTIHATRHPVLTSWSSRSSWRGKDKLGSTFLTVALRMNKDLPLDDITNASTTALEAGRARARVCIAWTIHYEDTAISNSLLRVATTIDSRLRRIPQLPDTEYPWSGKPFSQVYIRYRGNALFRERSALTWLTAEVDELLFSSERHASVTVLMQLAEAWDARASEWYRDLPEDLKYSKDLPAPLFELQQAFAIQRKLMDVWLMFCHSANYYCVMMVFCSNLDRHVQALSSLNIPGDEHRFSDVYVNLTAGLSDRKIAFAKMAANLMRDFRQKYSMKATLPYTFQASSMASFALLQWLHDHPNERDPPPLPSPDEILTATDMHPQTALNETYRCVLGAATQVMLARGVVALLNQTASHMNVKLPALDLQVEKAVADVTWRPSDLRHISSEYPNYAQGTIPTFSEAIGMEDILKEWGKVLPYR
ncbi:hypothetical protein LTS16_014100 [Friedmanniomyces endolithicus]|uniref:Xylanolytic transcriptional activator regulatory domain-containing protein n=1 Tax=Friedmanniomyces endolithicus TaxID=329885 RepID=A0AAN6G3K1_9PEZI|nr:hypothetical protein LTS09_010485 [Friedmanniomyces endolithicus]KAK0328162.1 hypothetical protein LTR82_000090 [Friedmanniomyces endolithicus]KAK0916967.1 hypothetical protein LTR57_012689 [Friedmanniomyces endolithicus]KAK0988000.1 hypothetical protein LTS01_009329 [Friedmanniomyces endolithicus]KAK1035976.1 hypothetical protein LTS16_014100 [Friedmanniomyces endolithicus]